MIILNSARRAGVHWSRTIPWRQTTAETAVPGSSCPLCLPVGGATRGEVSESWGHGPQYLENGWYNKRVRSKYSLTPLKKLLQKVSQLIMVGFSVLFNVLKIYQSRNPGKCFFSRWLPRWPRKRLTNEASSLFESSTYISFISMQLNFC